MKDVDAFHLPSAVSMAGTEWRYVEFDELRVRSPAASAAQLHELCLTLRENRHRYLANKNVTEIVDAIDAAAAALQSDMAENVQLISAVTGYSNAVVEQTLRRMFEDWRAPSLHEMLAAELGSAAVLDHAVPDPAIRGRQIAAFGFPLTFHVFAGNVPGVAVTSLIRALLVKSAALGKTASGEPVLAALFARALAGVAPDLAECLAVIYWPGGSHELECAAAESADAVIIYGGDAAVRSIAAVVPPDKRVIVHGPRLSFGIVGPKDEAVAPAAVAHAVAAFDQQGCVSPHVVYVTGGPDRARSFAENVARELRQLSTQLPRGKLQREEAVAIRNAVAEAEFAHDQTTIFGAESDSYAVIFELIPDFKVSCLNRVLYVKPIERAEEAIGLVPDLRQVQSVAVAGLPAAEKAELVRQLGFAGVSRVTTFERLPWPPMSWHHDGSSPLRELIWWQDSEI